jgi:hypothetical protein
MNKNFKTAITLSGWQNYLTNSKRKNTMKKLAIVAALVIAFTSMTYAQKNGSVPVTVNANIVQGLVLGAISGPLNFGNNASHTIVLGAVALADTVIAVASDARAVNFKVTGDGGQSISVTYPATGTLAGSVSGSLTFTPQTQWTTSTTQTGGTSFVSGASIPLSGSSYTAASKYVWLGGTLASPSAAAPGTYTGTFTITVAYSGL